MRNHLLSLLISTMIIIPTVCSAEKLTLDRAYHPPRISQKQHPAVQYLTAPRDFDFSKRNSNRLLVLLIEFQKEDPINSQTTGDGTFVLDASDYPADISLGRPPRDHEYFEAHLEALRLYYHAASLGTYDLDYDLYPKPGDDGSFNAYTLPNEMAYYHPTNEPTEVIVQRFEQYFHDSLAEADKDEDIDFSQYEHFMFIHAGSDWQHDVFGDTPSDIPSFFIHVGEGKEFIASCGTVIKHAANVPETISQDFRYDDNIVQGYGLINAVMAHEFGHSLGFVDLYNTNTHRPAVGYYDIMDSGGMMIVPFGGINSENIYYIEGILPALPNPWHRILAWEQQFKSLGYLKEIEQFDFNEKITLLPSSLRPDLAPEKLPYFIRIPTTDKEYLLIENRQIDADGDGGITVLGALPTNGQFRGILAPSSFYDDQPNYEYDYLLPGWIDDEGNDYGGGLLIWHIDDEVIYDMGTYNSQGEFVSNYDNNSVNNRWSRRGVKIVEADGLEDIGNPNSLYWRGTEYEPFYKYKPIIDEYGYFAGWDDKTIIHPDGTTQFIGELHNDALTPSSKPALISNTGYASPFAVYDISSYSLNEDEIRTMSFRFGSELFDNLDAIAFVPNLLDIGLIGELLSFPTLPLFTSQGIDLYTNISDTWDTHYLPTIPSDILPTAPITNWDINNDGNDEFVLVADHDIHILYHNGDISHYETFPDPVTDAPLFIENKFIVPTEKELFVGDASFEIANAKLAYNQNYLIASDSEALHFITISPPGLHKTYKIDDLSEEYYPVAFKDKNDLHSAVFIQNSHGSIFKIQGESVTEIFSLSSYTNEMPSQLALGSILDDGLIYLAFGTDDRVFAITSEGTLAPGFPKYIENKQVKPYSHPHLIEIDETLMLFPDRKDGYIAVNSNGDYLPALSFNWDGSVEQDQFYWDEIHKKLHFVFVENQKTVYCASISKEENPILWSGFRHNGFSLYEGTISYQPNLVAKLSGYAFPNPAQSRDEARLRINYAKEDISLQIYDIAGNLVHNEIYEKENNDIQDIRWDISKISSGVYFGKVSSGDESTLIPIAIEH